MATNLDQPESTKTKRMKLRHIDHEKIENQTNFSSTLATHLLSKEFPKSNLLFSPLSFHLILSLNAAGSKGKTLDQILSFLNAETTDELNSLYSELSLLIFADGSPNGGPQLTSANGVWVEKTLTLKPSFKHVMDTVYKASCNQADFQNNAIEVTKDVNLWVEKHTNGLIKEAMPDDAVNNLTRLIIVNAMYFKGSWRQEFDRSKTKEFDFHLLDGKKVKVPFMTSKKCQIVKAYDGFKVLALPYIHGEDQRRLTMCIFLPDANDGLQSLVKKMGSTSDFLDDHIPTFEKSLTRFLIPKFKISFGFEASDMLKKLGLVLPFDANHGLTEMVDSDENLFVECIHQKSFVEVNEEGTEVAVSLREMPRGAGMSERIPKKIDFVADHPFLFVIRENVSRIVLFMGQVVDPSVG